MALTFDHGGRYGSGATPSLWAARLGLIYAWSAFSVMWGFWICFVIFLANPAGMTSWWPLPMIDSSDVSPHTFTSALVDVGLIALFGLQHSVMARPRFKTWWANSIPDACERCTYVHAANVALFALILFWRPIPIELWSIDGPFAILLWVLFAIGWLILLGGGLSFGILDLLGVVQMQRWSRGQPASRRKLKTGKLYSLVPHPMYVGVLLGVWVTPRMTVGHLLLADCLTLYVLIAMRYEQRDLVAQFGGRYVQWRTRRPLS
jgi:protein-S-isoprenylcysteine O-methyltransferase Ste14